MKFEILKNLTSKIGSGATPTGGQSTYKKKGLSLIRSQNVLDMAFSTEGLALIDNEQASKLENVTVLKNDILLNITGDSIARVCKVPDNILPARVNQHVSIIRANTKIDADYLLYYLISRKEYLLTISRVGGTRNALTKEAIENIEIRLDENDKKIASVLSALDKKIELNNQINDNLEKQAKALYDYFFMQNADESWKVKNLFEVASVQYGFPFSTNFFNEDGNGVPVIRIRDILENSVTNFSTENDINTKYLIEKGDLLIGMDGNFHINYWCKGNCYLNQRVVRLRERELPIIFIKYQIEPYIKLKEKSVSRTTVGHLSDKDLKAINVLVPPTDIFKQVKPIYSNILQELIRNKNQNQQLSQLRDWLLPMLMNGQVKIS